jgi:hypothetical protein
MSMTRYIYQVIAKCSRQKVGHKFFWSTISFSLFGKEGISVAAGGILSYIFRKNIHFSFTLTSRIIGDYPLSRSNESITDHVFSIHYMPEKNVK